MKIDLNAIDAEQFMVHPHVIEGQTVFLVQPQHIGAKFTQANKHLRSSVWDSDGNLVSAGFPKFVNYGENPDNFPVPTSLKDTTIVEKVDGSLLIVSKGNGKHILRTRGTVDATKLNNGHEIEIFKQIILPQLDAFRSTDTWDCSYLFEWTSPFNKIVLNYGDSPSWFLVGAVSHFNYALAPQQGLNDIAKQLGLLRPPTYTFPTFADLMTSVELWKGKEGVVIYSKDDQELHKVKAASYLFLHRMKSELGSIDKVIDVWFSQDKPSYTDLENYISTTFDFELWNMIRPDVSRICDAWKTVQSITKGMQFFVDNTLLPLPTRREQAQKVISAYSTTNRANMVFTLLDQKPLTQDQEKKLLYQVLK